MAVLSLKRSKSAKSKPLASTQDRPFTSPIASAVVTVIAILWTIPTFGLLVTSFRSKEDIVSNGWWTSFTQFNRGKFASIEPTRRFGKSSARKTAKARKRPSV